MALRAPTVGETALAASIVALAWALLAGVPGTGGDAAPPTPGGAAAALRVAAVPAAPAGVPALPPEVAADPFGGRPWPSPARAEPPRDEAPVEPAPAPAAAPTPAPAPTPAAMHAAPAAAAAEPAPRAIDLEPEHTPG